MQKDETQKQIDTVRKLSANIHSKILKPIVQRLTGICIMILGIITISEINDIVDVGWQRTFTQVVVVIVSSYWFLWFNWKARSD